MKLFILLSLFFVSGCASYRFDSDRTSSSYYKGGDRLMISHLKSIVAGKESLEKDEPNDLKPAEEAIASTVASGVFLALNPDYYRSSYIRGRTLCHFEQETGFEIPCGNLQLNFIDQESKEIHPVSVEAGEFSFRAELNRRYAVSLQNPKFQIIRHLEKPLRMGDEVVLRIKKIL